MAKITTSTQTIYSDRGVTASWSWPSIGAYQHIEVNSAAWHWTASRYAVPYYDIYHNQMIPTNGGNGYNKEGITTANLGINTSDTSITAYFDMYSSNPGSADIWFVIDYTIVNDIPPSTITASNVTAGQTSTVTIANTAGLGSVKHRTTWSIGSYSHYEDTGANVSSASYTIPGSWQSAFSGTTGTLTITLKTMLVSDSSTVGTKTKTVTLTRDYNYDVTASTVTTAAATGGESNTVTFSNTMLAYAYHTVTWAIGNNTHTETTADGASSASYTIPTSWCEEFPSADSAAMTVTVQTYNTYDDACGSAVVKSVTLSVPAYTPNISGAATGVNQSWSLYVQNRSRVTITITASGMYGSTITSYSIAGHNLSANTASETSEVLTNSGTLNYTCTVTDTRGKIGTTTVSIVVQPYAAPMITAAQAYRCGPSDYDPLTTGTRGAYYLEYSYSTVDGNNTVTAEIELLLAGTTVTTISSPTTGQADLLYADLNARRSYSAVFTVTDALGNSGTFEIPIPTAEVYMYLSKALNSIGFGVYPEHQNSLELGNGYHLYIDNVEITT